MTKNSGVKAAATRGTDWARIDALTDADIESMAAADTENPATTAEYWAHAKTGMPPMKAPVNAKLMWTWWTGSSPRAEDTNHA